MSSKKILVTLCSVAIFIVLLFIFTNVGTKPDYVIPRRIYKILAIVLTSFCVSYSSVIFQTITSNKILTPSTLGFESIYLFIQTSIIFFSSNFIIDNKIFNFALSVICMIFFSMFLYKLIFKREDNNVYFLLIIGLIIGTVFQSLSTFMQVLIDPDEFAFVQNKMFASFNNINIDLFNVSLFLAICAFLYSIPAFKYLDVMLLGKENSINLGVDYNVIVKKLLFVISVFVSISTALVGPMIFLGILITNVTYEIFKTYKHSILLTGCFFITVVFLVGGQFLVEQVFSFQTTISIIINFIGGIYFLFIILKKVNNF